MTVLAPRRAVLLAAALVLSPAALPAQDTTEAPDISTVVATVNGEEITLGEIILMRANLPEQYQEIPPSQLLPALVDQAVTQRLLAEQGREAGYGESDLARLRADLDRRNFLAESVMRDVIREATTEEKLRERYEQIVEEMEPAEEARASHILVEEKARAEELMAELEDGAEFAELASEHSTGPTGEQGGDLGWFEKGQMVEPFAEAVFGAETGALVGPVETQFGWHVIKVTGKRDKPEPTFEEMREELSQQVSQEAVQAAVEAAKTEAEISVEAEAVDPAAIRRDDLLTEE